MSRSGYPLPSARLAVALAVAAPVFAVSPSAALQLDAFIIVLAAVDAWWGWRKGGPEIGRSAPSRISRGAGGEVEIAARLPDAAAGRIRITDDLPEEIRREGVAAADIAVERGRPAIWRYRVVADERGRHPLGPIHTRTLSPLGLAWIQRTHEVETAVQVQPGLDDLRRYRLLALQHRLRDLGLRASRLRGQAGSFESLRDYIRGDDPRHIEWKASARHRRMVVRQYEVERSQQLLLAIDLGRVMTEEIGEGRSRLDHALSAALLLAYVAGLHHDKVGLFAFSDRIELFLPPSRLGIDRLADALTDMRGRLVEPHYPAAFSGLGRHLKRRSLVVLFTDVIDPGASRALLAHLAPTARRHLPLLVALRNPQLEAASTSPDRTPGGVALRAAAEDLLEQRAKMLTAMRRSGVLVADTRPDDAPPEVVNAYLDVKRRALL